MIETMVPKDVRKYETKILGPLTARNAIAVGVACLFDFILWKTIIGPLNVPPNFIMYILILVDVPILAIGFIQMQGLPFEKYMKSYIRNVFIMPKKRKARNTIVKNEKKKVLTSKEKKDLEVKNSKFLSSHNIKVSK